jgi:hypothetical protein
VTDDPRLEPCPHCGGPGRAVTVDLGRRPMQYGCTVCQVYAMDPDDWNERIPPTATRAYLDGLIAAVNVDLPILHSRGEVEALLREWGCVATAAGWTKPWLS